MDEQLQPTLIQNLMKDLHSSKDAKIRKNAAEKLGEQENNSNHVLSALRTAEHFDSDKLVREAAYNALVKLGIKKVLLEESKPLNSEEKPLKIWQVVGIGALVGFVALFILLIILFYPEISRAGTISFLGIPFGIIGAMAGRHLGKNWLSVFFGSVIATILVPGACLFLFLSCMLGC